MDTFAGLSGGEAFFRNHLETLTQENAKLKAKVQALERENSDLKKSVFDISLAYTETSEKYKELALQCSSSISTPQPFSIDSALTAPKKSSQLKQALLDASREHSTSDPSNKRGGKRQMKVNATLSGHVGPVYRSIFSSSGALLGSCSFDCTVRVWNWGQCREVLSLRAHDSLVSDIAWRSDDTHIASCAFDKTIKVWDISSATAAEDDSKSASPHADLPTNMFPVEGLPNAVLFSPADPSLVIAGTSRHRVVICDVRSNSIGCRIENDASVTALYAYQDGTYVISGDIAGGLKLWDVRMRDAPVMEEYSKSDAGINHIHASRGSHAGDEGRCLMVSSGDNIIRVYDRGAVISDHKPKPEMVLLHNLIGHKVMNYPIRCSSFCGAEYDFDERAKEDEIRPEARTFYNSFMVATASADGVPLLYDISKSVDVASKHLQALRGHDARVYDASFHPRDPVLATASADTQIVLWSPKTSPSNFY